MHRAEGSVVPLPDNALPLLPPQLCFLDPHNNRAMIDPGKERYWLLVDLYVDAEHAACSSCCTHGTGTRCCYGRRLDERAVPKLFNQGMILGSSFSTAGYCSH